jgi:hypothetical protein
MDPRAKDTWARTRLLVWPEAYVLASFDLSERKAAAVLVAETRDAFAALVVERDEVSLTLPEPAFHASPLRARAKSESGPWRAITLDIDIELNVVGYLAPAAERLARAGVSIVPQCAFLKDHLLVHARDLDAALRTLEGFAAECRG